MIDLNGDPIRELFRAYGDVYQNPHQFSEVERLLVTEVTQTLESDATRLA